MKEVLKIFGILLGIIVLLGLVFFIIDNNRISKQEKPIFCIKNPAGVIMDGGTIEYFGLGYKIIDFHTLAGFDDIKIGTWAMKYEDFRDEMREYEIKFEENGNKIYSKVIDTTLIKLNIPNDWNYEEINNANVKFELNIYKDSKEKSASLCFYKEIFAVCGTGLTSEKLILNNEKKASVGYYDGSENWNFISFYEINKNIAFLNNGLDSDEAKEVLEFVKTINISNEDISNTNISITIKENTLTNGGTTIIIKNNSDKNYYYGPEYYIEKYQNGIYTEVDPKAILSWNAVLSFLGANEKKEETIDWTIGYDKLDHGKYRLVRYFTAEENITSSANVREKIYVEFEIK